VVRWFLDADDNPMDNRQWFIVSYDSAKKTGVLQEAIALSKPTIIVNIRANENAMTQWIGLVRDHGGHLVNQPCFSVIEKFCKTTFE